MSSNGMNKISVIFHSPGLDIMLIMKITNGEVNFDFA